MDKSPLLVWFRDDLRATDHPALAAAAKTGQPIVALYLLDDESKGLRPLGAASRWWLAGSLRAHAARLQSLGVPLVLRHGAAEQVVPALVREAGITRVHWTRRYGHAEQIDRTVADKLRSDGIEVHSYGGALLDEPEDVQTKSGGPFKVFTPFMKAARSLGEPKAPIPAPKKLEGARGIASDKLESWSLEPSKPDWAAEMHETWTRGEAGAQERLYDFLDGGAKGYANGRDRPDQEHVSHLSPHLRFGEISSRQIWHAAYASLERGGVSRDIEKFIAEIYWREFSYHLLHHFPDFATKNFQPRFDKFPWRKDKKALRAWQHGQTGYPLVDAGMRQLWRTGWMHNRVRMVCASFLVKHLLVDWREGERWFWDTLVDADPANNPASWQWVAGSGADAAPYFRIFNPTTQGEKFDPNGNYVRRYVPELAETADRSPLANTDYPQPIVEHAQARVRALEAFGKTRD